MMNSFYLSTIIGILMVVIPNFCFSQTDLSGQSIDTIPHNTPEPYQAKPNKQVDYTYHQIDADSCKLFVKEAGNANGSPIIFLHGGWGMEHSIFSPYFTQQVDISEKHRIVFYDQRGSARSPCQDYESISVQKHVNDLELIRKKLDIDSFKIIAHSMGSYLAFQYLKEYDQFVSDLLIIGSMPLKGGLREWAKTRRAIRKDVKQRPSFKEVMKAENLLGLKDEQINEKENSQMHKIAMAANNLYKVQRWQFFNGAFSFNQKAAQAAASSMNPEWDFTETIKDLPFEPVFILGSYDFLYQYNDSYMKSFNENTNLKLYFLPKAGHVAWIDRPKTVKEIIENNWLKN